jgi:hypothetical protein
MQISQQGQVTITLHFYIHIISTKMIFACSSSLLVLMETLINFTDSKKKYHFNKNLLVQYSRQSDISKHL